MRLFDFPATLKYIGLKSINLLFPKETVFIGLIYPPSPQGGFCKYQETYAKDVFKAIEGDLVFVCTLDNVRNCPELKEDFRW